MVGASTENLGWTSSRCVLIRFFVIYDIPQQPTTGTWKEPLWRRIVIVQTFLFWVPALSFRGNFAGMGITLEDEHEKENTRIFPMLQSHSKIKKQKLSSEIAK